ncbi:hypothetical protein IF803_40175 [Bradyrhizobium sp. UFLA06-06]
MSEPKLLARAAFAIISKLRWARFEVSSYKPTKVESIVLTALRIRVQGYQAPTPVTVVDQRSLERNTRIDIGAALRKLPLFAASPASSAMPAADISDEVNREVSRS